MHVIRHCSAAWWPKRGRRIKGPPLPPRFEKQLNVFQNQGGGRWAPWAQSMGPRLYTSFFLHVLSAFGESLSRNGTQIFGACIHQFGRCIHQSVVPFFEKPLISRGVLPQRRGTVLYLCTCVPRPRYEPPCPWVPRVPWVLPWVPCAPWALGCIDPCGPMAILLPSCMLSWSG